MIKYPLWRGMMSVAHSNFMQCIVHNRDNVKLHLYNKGCGSKSVYLQLLAIL